MKLKVICAFAVAAAMVSFIPKTAVAGTSQPSYCSPCLFYGGDLAVGSGNDNGLANETDTTVSGSPYGAGVFAPFVVPTGQTWTVTGLFTNDLMSYTLQNAYWEIRSGVSSGNGGSLLFSGTDANATQTPTGRSDFGFTEYTVEVNGLSGIMLGAGTYWEAVIPQCPTCSGRSFESNSTGNLNTFGPPEPQNMSFFNSAFFGANYLNANTQGGFPGFSDGVIGTSGGGGGGTPEPSSLILLGTGLLGLAGAARRRFGK